MPDKLVAILFYIFICSMNSYNHVPPTAFCVFKSNLLQEKLVMTDTFLNLVQVVANPTVIH